MYFIQSLISVAGSLGSILLKSNAGEFIWTAFGERGGDSTELQDSEVQEFRAVRQLQIWSELHLCAWRLGTEIAVRVQPAVVL